MTVTFTIIGLDLIGASIGLALGEHKDQVQRVGHDRNSAAAKEALKMGAVDRIESNLPKAAQAADIILLCEPFHETEETLKHISVELTNNRCVIDLAGSKQAFNQQLSKLAPEFRNAINLILTINPELLGTTGNLLKDARADLFKGGLSVLCAHPGASETAVDWSTAFAGMIKTHYMFADPAEADGLYASTQHLPLMLSATYVTATSNQPGWRESRKLTDRAYFGLGSALRNLPESKSYGKEILGNKDNITRWLDLQIEELTKVKKMLSDADTEGIDAYVDHAVHVFDQLHGQRLAGEWDQPTQEMRTIPSFGQQLNKLFGLKDQKKK